MGDVPPETQRRHSPPADTNGLIDPVYHYHGTPEGPYIILDQYHSNASKLRVAYVGAGAIGLCLAYLAYRMEKTLEPGSFELTLFNKNPHFGGI